MTNKNFFPILAMLMCFGIFSLTVIPEADGAEPAQKYLVLCYHSIPEKYNGDPGAISASNLTEQLSWLRDSGYVAISMDDVLKAKAGIKKLPELSFMLTVDDGYEDFYKNAFPILKIFKVPAVLGLVGRWIEEPGILQNDTDPYFAKQHFVTWAQVKEMAESGLVEMASHSYDLHHGILANPQKNMEPAAVTLLYDAATKTYETAEQRRLRIRADLTRNSELIARHTGRRPRIMIWPYGAFDGIGAEEAERAGMSINFTLPDDLANVGQTRAVPRILVEREAPLSSFSYMVQFRHQRKGGDPVRAVRLSLDRIYDPDPVQQDQKLGKTLEQLLRLGVNTVLLQPHAAPGQDGLIREVYFPNSVLPMRADLLNRVVWQLNTRARVNALILIDTGRYAVAKDGKLRRLDFSNDQDRDTLRKLYTGLSMNTVSQGLVFDGGRADAAQLAFNGELLKLMQYYRPPTLPFFASGSAVTPTGPDWQSAYGALAGRYSMLMVHAPVKAGNAELEAFARALAPQQINILTLPLQAATPEDLRAVGEKIRFFEHRGIADFMLDSDSFLDDPAKLEQLRKFVSLKNNPFQSPGR